MDMQLTTDTDLAHTLEKGIFKTTRFQHQFGAEMSGCKIYCLRGEFSERRILITWAVGEERNLKQMFFN